MASIPEAITPERIRERAYELWERNHRPDGLEMQCWLTAERELRAELETRQQADTPTGSASDSGGSEAPR